MTTNNTNMSSRHSLPPDQAFSSFREYLLRKKPLNTLLSIHFEMNKENLSLQIPLTRQNSSDKISLFFNIKCVNFPNCIYDLEEILQIFVRLNYSRKTLFPCKSCEIALRFKFFFRDQSLQDQIDYFWKEHNLLQRGKFCQSIEISRSNQIIPIFIDKKLSLPTDEPINLEHYPEMSRYKRENLYELLFLYEKYLRKKPDTHQLSLIYDVEFRNKDIKSLLDSFLLTKKFFKLWLLYFNNLRMEQKEKVLLILISFKENSYKFDETFGFNKNSAEISTHNKIYFAIRCSKPPKVFTFCEFNQQKSHLTLYLPYNPPNKDKKTAVFLIKKLINFSKEQFNHETAGFSIIWIGIPNEKDQQFGLFTLFLYQEILKETSENLLLDEYHLNFYEKILWVALYISSMANIELRKDMKSPVSSPKKKKKMQTFLEDFNQKFPETKGPMEILITRTHHEILWRTNEIIQRIDIVEKSQKLKNSNYEFFPKIEGFNLDNMWNISYKEKIKRVEKPFGLSTKESVILSDNEFPKYSPKIVKFWKGFLGDEYEFKQFWIESLKKPNTPLKIKKKEKKNLEEIKNAPNLVKIMKILEKEPYVSPRNSSNKGEFYDFNSKEIKLRKTELINLIKNVRNEAISERKKEKKLKNPDNWTEPIKIIEELGEIEKNEQSVFVEKKRLKKILYEKEEKVLEKLLTAEQEAMEKYKMEYDKYVEKYKSQLSFDYILGYYYFTNPQLYQELVEEYNERMKNKIEKTNDVTVFNKTDFQKKIEMDDDPNENEMLLETFLKGKFQDKIESLNPIENNGGAGFLGANKQFRKEIKQQTYEPIKQQKIVGKSNFLSVEAPIFSYASPVEYEEIIAQLLDFQVSKKEYQKFRTYGILSENMLNFIIKYYCEKHSYMQKKDYYSVQFRILALSTKFMAFLMSNNEESFLQVLYPKRNFFKKLDLLLIPFFLYEDHCVMILADFQNKKLSYFDNYHKKKGIKDCKNDPYIQLVRNFLEKEYRNSYLKPSTLYEWDSEYRDIEHVGNYQKTCLMIARYVYIIYNMRMDFETDEFIMNDFRRKICEFFMNVGFNKNRISSKNFIL